MLKKAKEWWERHAGNYQKDTNIPIDIHYGPGSPNESELNLIGDVSGKNVLEIGCGAAQCSIAFAQKGAKVTGMDLSSEQIRFAKELAQKNNVDIQLYEQDIVNLSPVTDKSQDVVFSACALAYIDDLTACFKEVHRVLKDDGLFVWSVGHPFFDMVNPKDFTLWKSYLETGVKVEGEETGSAFSNVHRTISDYFNTAIEAGFIVEKMIEPDSRVKRPYDPWYGLWDYTPELLAKVPATLIFKCRKK
jgi:SAM-dependent methyltransferase